MKTVKSGSEVKRVDDNEAENLVANKGWKYCPKSEFRKGRPTPKQEVAKPKVEKMPKRSKKDKEMDMAIKHK